TGSERGRASDEPPEGMYPMAKASSQTEVRREGNLLLGPLFGPVSGAPPGSTYSIRRPRPNVYCFFRQASRPAPTVPHRFAGKARASPEAGAPALGPPRSSGGRAGGRQRGNREPRVGSPVGTRREGGSRKSTPCPRSAAQRLPV